MKLWNLMNMDLYREMVLLKYIRTNRQGNYLIINYTESAQYEKMWNEATLQARGLIVDNEWNVVARPFDKFFNYGENPDDAKLLDYRVEVTDKMDGSLGILFGESKLFGHYPTDPNAAGFIPAIHRPPSQVRQYWNVATKGSMNSEQACMMQDILNDKYADVEFSTRWTYMFEIIYPENRIVLDYGDTADLFLIGARHLETGLVRPAEAVTEWPGPRVQTFSYKTLREALEAPPRPNAEGFVVYFPDLNYRVKIKQADYVALHRVVTGLTERRIWENMQDGKTLEDLLEVVPDEWHEWLGKVYGDIIEQYNLLTNKIQNEYEDLVYRMRELYGMSWTRKQFAEEVNKSDYAGFLFAIYDGKVLADKVWPMVRPASTG